MLITKTSPLSGIEHTREIDVTQERLDAWQIGGAFIQDAMPDVPAADREFLLTGVTPEEWNLYMPDDDDDDYPGDHGVVLV
jgi:hypothetical protein